MSTFFQELWESIFTPGPTPTLLKAANISFACLQVVLFALLLTTYSIHFIILSFLCSGLWWSINWFAAELKASQEREEREKAAQAREAALPAPTDDSETEVETAPVSSKSSRKKETKVGGEAAATGVDQVPADVKQRSAAALDITSGTQSSASTEDEWEKVSENENEKDK
jgi:hypothetical protein